MRANEERMDRSPGAQEVQAGGEGRRWVCAEIKRGHIMLKKKKKQDKVNPTKFYHILHGEVRKSF